MSTVEDAVRAIRSGEPVILPTDTVYGLCASPYRATAAQRVYALKRRPSAQPIALLANDVDMLFECVPELHGRAGTFARALLPGPLTLVLPNPAHRFPWLTGETLDRIGVRIARLPGIAADVLEQVGAVMATSANLAGGPDPRALEEVPKELRDGCAAELDAGTLLGLPSTVIDLTGPEPRVLREGAVPAAQALERALAVQR